MTFGTFLLYFIGAVVVLMVGWIALRIVLNLVAATVVVGSDSIKQARDTRAALKWERKVDELDKEK